jgi:hypothetical protein
MKKQFTILVFIIVITSSFLPVKKRYYKVITNESNVVQLPTGAPPHNENNPTGSASVNIPLGSEVISAKAYMLNSPWREQNCELQPDNTWVECPQNGEPSIGWAKARVTVAYTNSSINYTASFYNWSDCNKRKGKLVVVYEK